MKTIDTLYIDGAYTAPHGSEMFDLHNPATGEVIGQVRLGDEVDARAAIAAAKRVFPSFSKSTKAQRIAWLNAMAAAIELRSEELNDAIVMEYGAPSARSAFMVGHAVSVLRDAARTLESYDFTRMIGTAAVTMEPLGVVGIITPWNSDAGFICGKLAMVIASGSTAVVKPSERASDAGRNRCAPRSGASRRCLERRQWFGDDGRRRTLEQSGHREDKFHRIDGNRSCDPPRRCRDLQARHA